MVREFDGYLAMSNPTYLLLPRDHADDAD